MKRCKIFFLVSLALMAFYGLTPAGSWAAEQKVTYINLGTAGMGGPSYILGVGWAKIISTNVPWLKATAVPGGGGYANLKRAMKGELLTATVPGDAAYNMYHGLGMYKEKLPVRAMFEYAPATLFLCTRAESKIFNVPDLKGMKIGMGAAGSGLADTTTTILDTLGLKSGKDYRPVWYDYMEVVHGLMDKTIDAGFLFGGYPNPAVVELTRSIDVRILTIPREIPGKYKYMTPAIIKGGSYKGVKEDIPTIDIDILVCTIEQADKDIIYTVTKTLMEHHEEVRKIHNSASEFGLKTALRGVAIPLHEGSAKYYREVGLIK